MINCLAFLVIAVFVAVNMHEDCANFSEIYDLALPSHVFISLIEPTYPSVERIHRTTLCSLMIFEPPTYISMHVIAVVFIIHRIVLS